MLEPKVTIIILNWNGLTDTLECLASLTKLSYRKFKVVVVDNGSSDNSVEIISKKFPDVDLIQNSTNEGFCKGNNIGVRHALECGTEYVWLLNNDCEVETDTLEKLIEAAESSPEIGLVSPVIHYFSEKSKVQFAGSCINRHTLEIKYPENKEDAEALFQIGSDVILWGTALLIKKEIIDRVGLLDEQFFAYFEDTDYSLRTLKSGYRNILCKSVRVYHKRAVNEDVEETKSAYFYYLLERNRLLLKRKELQQGLFARIGFYIMALSEGSSHTLNYPMEHTDIALMGVWHGLKQISGKLKTEPPMPVVLKKILIALSGFHPIFFANLFTLDFKAAFKGFMRWLKKAN